MTPGRRLTRDQVAKWLKALDQFLRNLGNAGSLTFGYTQEKPRHIESCSILDERSEQRNCTEPDDSAKGQLLSRTVIKDIRMAHDSGIRMNPNLLTANVPGMSSSK